MSIEAAIRLSPEDNVAVCRRPVTKGERIAVDGIALIAEDDVALGHKLALVPLETGDKVLKYGMPIGSVTCGVRRGGWVHVHNMKSDYIPAHLRDAHGDHA